MPIYQNNDKNGVNVAIYIRVSTLHQIDRDSLPMQREDLSAYARFILKADNFTIFEDAGYSGKNVQRPEFQKMMSKIRQRQFTHLLVWKIDRISRNLLDFATMYNELKSLGVTFVSKNEQFDTSTAMGEAMLKIILIFAELERNMTSERVSATMISRANNGLWNGGRIPYGYDYNSKTRTFTINESEAKIIRLIHNKYEELRSLTYLAHFLNENGYLTRANNEWTPTTLHIILTSMFYCGDYEYNRLKEGNRKTPRDKSEWVMVENHHDAILDKQQKERILAILNENSKIKHKSDAALKHTHIFAKLLVCGNCGKIMLPTPSQRNRTFQYSNYRCSTRKFKNSECKFTSDPIVGEFLFNYILNMLNAQKAFTSNTTTQELEKQLLKGDTFLNIKHIESDGLNDLYNALSSQKLNGAVFAQSLQINTATTVNSDLTKLRVEKQKYERALERLTKLFLYSDDTMSEAEFIIQKSSIVDNIENVNKKIGLFNTTPTQETITDDEFVKRASEFIIAQKLTKRTYINFKEFADSVDRETIKVFVNGIIDCIIMIKGRVDKIVFKNGLSHQFIYKNENEPK